MAGPSATPLVAALLAAALAAQPPAGDFGKELQPGIPEQVGIGSAELCALVEHVRAQRLPVLSLLVSRRGRLVLELYASGIDREQAHYTMSVTKSVLALLVGIAVGDGVLPQPRAPFADALPRGRFGASAARFSRLPFADVLDMRALDCQLPPHDASAAAVERQRAFLAAPNRFAFALEQPLLAPGTFQYNDVTPVLAAGALQYAVGTGALEFAQRRLFGPLGCRNAEWMHQDAAGLDNGGYGLRLRPIDMHKLGVLVLRKGRWNGEQLVPEAWMRRLGEPTLRSRDVGGAPVYGCYWWTKRLAPGWTVLEANGWKGQRIAVIPEQELVVTMTALFGDAREHGAFDGLLTGPLRDAVRTRNGAALPRAATAHARLRALLDEPATLPAPAADVEARMIPAAAPKEARKPFRPE